MSDTNDSKKIEKKSTTIDRLTDEQIELIDVWRDKYLDKFFHNKHVTNFEEVESYMHWFYKEFEIGDTPKVVLLESPEAIAKLVALCKGADGGKIPSNDTEAVEKINSIVGSDKFMAYHLSNEEMNEVVDNFPSDMTPDYSEKPSYYLSAFNSWVAFYDYFDKNTIVKLETEELFNLYQRILDLNIFWSVAFDGVVLVSKGITGYSRDDFETIRLHDVNQPSLRFSDGSGIYMIHGRTLSKKDFEAVQNKTYTFEDFTKETNEEIKNAILAMMDELYGSEHVFHFMAENLNEVDTYIDKKEEHYLEGTLLGSGDKTSGQTIGTYTLFKGWINADVEIAYVRCYCPSTDRMFFLGVDPEHEKADDAIASLLQIPSNVISHVNEIRRQGERFTLLFKTEEAQDVWNNYLTSINDGSFDPSTLSFETLSGEEYFKTLTYEY